MIENTYSCTVWLIGRAAHRCNLTLSSILCMVDFLSQLPEDSKSEYTKELQYQLKLMSDSFQNIQWFDNLEHCKDIQRTE